MRLRTALNEFKRNRDGRFPAECRTIDGAFSAHGDRLVYVDPDGGLRDYSSPLSGLYGIDRARLGIETETDTRWFDEFSTVRQHYYRETNVVETEYAADGFTVHQYDLTLGRAHVTHIELRGAIPPNAELTALPSPPRARNHRSGGSFTTVPAPTIPMSSRFSTGVNTTTSPPQPASSTFADRSPSASRRSSPMTPTSSPVRPSSTALRTLTSAAMSSSTPP